MSSHMDDRDGHPESKPAESPKDWNEDEDVLNRVSGSDCEVPWETQAKAYGLRVVDATTGLVALDDSSDRNAMRWGIKKKLWHTTAYGFTTFTAQFCISVTAPASEQIARELHVGLEVATLVFSVCILGNMVGPPIFAPLSEMAGRKPAIFIPTFFAGVCMCICANLSNAGALVVFRFLTGVFGAAPIVVAVGAMGDMWSPVMLVTAIVIYAINLVTGSVSAPTLGALLVGTGNYGWRWTCWLGGLISMFVAAVNIVTISESFRPVVEQTAARKLRLHTKHWSVHSAHDAWDLSAKEYLTVHVTRPIMILMTPIVLLMDLFSAFIYGVFFLLIGSVEIQYMEVHNFVLATSSLPLFGFLLGIILGGMINIVVARRYIRITRETGSRPPPEERLIAMMLAGWLLPCGIFIYGWTMKEWIHWIVPTIGLMILGMGFLVIFQGCLMYIIDNYLQFIASAIASNTIMRSVFGGVFPLFGRQMFNKMNVHWASSLLGFVSVALCLAPYLFYVFGPQLRQHDPFRKAIERS